MIGKQVKTEHSTPKINKQININVSQNKFNQKSKRLIFTQVHIIQIKESYLTEELFGMKAVCSIQNNT